VFPRTKRLSRADFPIALKGRRASSEHFVAVFSESNKGYAVVVPKKVARLSVTRHRIKRQISSILKTLLLPPALVLFPRSSVNSVSYQDMKVELANLLAKMSR
jgi:ribonuclease P protein component